MTAPVQLAVRFILELAAIVAAGVVGASVGSPPFGLVGGVGLAAIFIVVWGLFLAPRARFPQPAMVCLVVGTLVMEAPALGLAIVGQATRAILVAAILANAVALAASGATTHEAVTR